MGVGVGVALETIWILTQNSEPGSTNFVDACNGFNEISRLVMLWMVRHRWPARVRFLFNCYRHWSQLLLLHPGDTPVILLIREGVTQGDPLLVVLYDITLVPLSEELRDADPTLLLPFYADDAAFEGSSRRSAAQLQLMIYQGTERGYFPEPAKSLFIACNPEDKEAAKKEFEQACLNLNYVDSGRYLGAYWGPREELEYWMQPKVEAWAHGVCTLSKIANWYPQFAYTGLGMSLQLEWQYLQSTIPGVGSLMDPI